MTRARLNDRYQPVRPYHRAADQTCQPGFHLTRAGAQRLAAVHVIETAYAVDFLAPANRRGRVCNPEPAA